MMHGQICSGLALFAQIQVAEMPNSQALFDLMLFAQTTVVAEMPNSSALFDLMLFAQTTVVAEMPNNQAQFDLMLSAHTKVVAEMPNSPKSLPNPKRSRQRRNFVFGHKAICPSP